MNSILDCVADIGEQMLISGAEVHRVEDSVNRMCLALGAQRVDCFIIPSSMVITLHDKDGCAFTQTRRIQALGTNYQKLNRLNSLSRSICKNLPNLESIREELDSIINSRTYPFFVECAVYAIVSCAFTIFFGGGVVESLLSAVVGLALRFAVAFSDRLVGNLIFTKFLSSLSITVLSYLFVFCNFVASPDNIIIGNIMLIIPGLGFTNALRDLFTGDSIAGILRFLEAVLSAIAIAAGYFIFVLLIRGVAI